VPPPPVDVWTPRDIEPPVDVFEKDVAIISDTGAPDVEAPDAAPSPEVLRGTCGCRIPTTGTPDVRAWAALTALAAALSLRTRRRR
jgi:MYXO-CTERM domain-containing protein